MNKTFNSIKDCCFALPTRVSCLLYENIVLLTFIYFFLLKMDIRIFQFLLESCYYFFFRILQSLNNQKTGTVNNSRSSKIHSSLIAFLLEILLDFACAEGPACAVSTQVKVLALLR